MGQRGPDGLRPAQVTAFRCGVQSFEFLGGESDGHDLHGLRPTPRPTSTAALQGGRVVSGRGLVGPLLDLLFSHHQKIV